MAVLQYGGIIEGVASTATAGGTTTLVNTSPQIQVWTGTANQTIILPNATTYTAAGAKFEFYNTSTGTLTIETNGGATLASVSPNTSLILKLASNGTSAGTWVEQATSAAASGSKNYLSAYTASTASGTANTGNGNWELGSTTGWSLAHSAISSFIPTSVATAGSAFSSSSGGSAASSNLSITTVASSQLSGLYSGNLASTAASTAGDMLITSAFNIDLEDQAKMMQVKFYYKDVSGTINNSGTSSNTFAVWIYDVTNGAWIMPQGVYNLVQGSGVGYATATFQTTSNSTKYQLALININATTGAYSLYVDDFSVGPQTAPSGPAMTDWTIYSTSSTGFVGFGTVTGVSLLSRRVGDTLEVKGQFTAGTPTATTAQIPIGYNGIQNVAIDLSKLNANQIIGTAAVAQSSTTLFTWSMLAPPTNGATYVQMGIQGSTASSATVANGNSLVGGSQGIEFYFTVPIVGWSSNSNMSSDTDTRVVKAYRASSGSLSLPTGTATQITSWATASFDTTGSWGTSSYTVPVSGYYDFLGKAYFGTVSGSGAAAFQVFVYQNGVNAATVLESDVVASSYNNTSTVSSGGVGLKCNAGDVITFYAQQGSGNTGSLSSFQITITRNSGPAVITATESVTMSYTNTAGTSVGTSATLIPFATKQYDSHNAWATNTYTVPISGKYRVTATLQLSSTNIAAGSAFYGLLYKNGSSYEQIGQAVGNGAANYYQWNGAITVSCNAGDTLSIYSISGTATTLATGNCFICIERVGN